MRLLLLSNSTNFGGTFLGHAGDALQRTLGSSVTEVLFIPYAAVRLTFDDFTARVAERFGPLGYGVRSVHQERDRPQAVLRAQAIVVGGGNTFHLLAMLYQEQLIEPMRERVAQGAPYVGWSAGANLACPTIRTTNDMPIVEPPSFNALGLVPFQINPHYTDARIPNHGGETRGERLQEYLAANPATTVIGLPEGTMLELHGDVVTYSGDQQAMVLQHGKEPKRISGGPLSY